MREKDGEKQFRVSRLPQAEVTNYKLTVNGINLF